MTNIIVLSCQTLAGLLLLGGFLTPYHMEPWRAAFAEFGVFYALIFFMVAKIIGNSEVKAPASMIPIIVLILTVGGFLIFGYENNYIRESYYLFFSYVAIFSLAFIAGLNTKLISNTVNVFIYIVFFSAAAQIGIGSAQWLGLLEGVPLDNWWAAAGSVGGRASGNIWQANNYASFVLWGFISFVYIASENFKKDNFYSKIILSIVALFFAYGMVIAQSRTSILSLAVLLFYAVIVRKKFQAHIKYLIACFYLMVIAVWYMVPELANLLTSGHSPVSARSFTAPDLRMPAWQMYLSSASDSLLHFLFGRGWGGIAPLNVNVAGAGDTYNLGTNVFAHTHNIFLDILISFGVLGLLILLQLIWRASNQLLCKDIGDRKFLLGCMLLVFFVHSNLELPHWYGYFLWPAGFLSGLIFEQRKIVILNPFILKCLLLVIFSISIVLGKQYTKYELAFSNYAMQLGLYGKIITPIKTDSFLLPGLSEVLNTAAIPIDSNFNRSGLARLELSATYNPTPQTVMRVIHASVILSERETYSYFNKVLCRLFGHTVALSVNKQLEQVSRTFPFVQLNEQCG